MRLVVCDGNRILGEALAVALQAHGHLVLAATTTPSDGLDAVATHRPDACLMDLRLPRPADGLAAVRAMRQQHPGTALLVLSSLADPAAWSEVRRLGVAGCLGKDQSVSQIADALAVIAAGGLVVDPMLPHRPGTHRDRARGRYPPNLLTPREKEVLRRIVAGQGTQQMARDMNIGTSTLRTYVKSVLAKLGACSRLQAAALARREAEELLGGGSSRLRREAEDLLGAVPPAWPPPIPR